MAIKDMSKFQLIFTGIFAGFIVVGVLIFAFYRSNSSGIQSANLTVWGPYSDETFRMLKEVNGLQADKNVNITYVKKAPEDFENDFILALADGNPPDLIFISQAEILKHDNKLFPIPYANIDARTFKDTYVQEAELFMTPTGIIALPLTVDPMVMYWNRDIFQNASVAIPPKYWDEFYDLVNVFTKKDGATNIIQSAIALGEYQNVNHAKEIISTLIMQAGSPIVSYKGNEIVNDFATKFDLPITPTEAAVNFYTQFSNPSKITYSWNRTPSSSKGVFLAGDLAVYFGFASELFEIQDKNPNLNYDVTYIPQSRESKDKILFGSLNALAVVKASRSLIPAAQVALRLSSKEGITALSQITGLPPARRDLLSAKQASASQLVFYQSALWARGWLDPDSHATDIVFASMINSITSGRSRISEAVSTASIELTKLIQEHERRNAIK